MVAALCGCGLLAFFLLTPKLAVTDMQGWRQADTQTIAENLTAPGASLFYPAVAWGGDGPGYVETELQLYTSLVASLMRAFGHGEWAGQFLSMLFTTAAAVVVFLDQKRRRGFLPAAFGVFAFIGTRSVVHVATSIQPDSLSLLFYVVAFALLLRFRDYGKTSDLVAYTGALGLAILTKPTAAQLGLASALILLLTARPLLKRPGIWISWGVVLATCGLYLWHARHVYLAGGNSFGLFKGGNEKIPTVGELTSPTALYHAIRLIFVWGVGYVGTFALVAVVVRRKLSAEILALLAGNVVMTIAFIRITSTMAGSHYVVPAAIIGSEAVGIVVSELPEISKFFTGSVRWLAVAGLSVVLGLGIASAVRFRRVMYQIDPDSQLIYEAGVALAKFVGPRDLIVVRAKLYDPRIFYIAHVRGWHVNRFKPDPGKFEERIRHGARYFVDPVPDRDPTVVGDWLTHNARLVPHAGAGNIWDLSPDAGTRAN